MVDIWRAAHRAASVLVLSVLVACGPASAPPPAQPTAAPAAKPTTAPAAQATAAPAAAAKPTDAAKPAAQPTTAPAAGRRGGQVVFASVGSDVRILNPILQSDTVSGGITDRLFNPLVNTDPKTGAIIPELATSWDSTPDGLTFTFKLRDGVKFHDGQPLTAEDAKFTLDVLKTNKVQTTRTSNVEKIASTEAVDPLTLKVVLSEAYCPFLNDLTALGILPKHLLGNSANLNEDPFNLRPIGSGPFKFVEWVKDDHITMEANDAYWGGRPNIDRLIFRPLKDRAALIAQLKTGEVDLAEVEASELREIESQSHLQVTKYYSTSMVYLAYNTRQPGLDDVQVRQALNHAVDRKVLIDDVLLGEGRPITSDILPDSWAFNPNVKSFDFDPNRARQMLDAAGWTVGAGGIRQKAGNSLKFTMWTNSGNKVREAVVTIAQQQLKDVGVDIEVQLQEFAAMINRINKLEFDMFVSGFVVGADPDNYDLWHSTRKPDPATGKEGFNRAGFSTPELDRSIEQARTVPGCDQAQRKELYGPVQERVAEGAGWNFLFQQRTPVVNNKRVSGVEPTTYRRVNYNADKWSVQP